MKNKIIFGISKIFLAAVILFYSFSVTGPQKGMSIWLGCVIAFPVFLWGILDFVKKDTKDDGEEK